MCVCVCADAKHIYIVCSFLFEYNTYIYIFINVHTHIYTYEYIYIYIHTTHIFIYVCMFVCMWMVSINAYRDSLIYIPGPRYLRLGTCSKTRDWADRTQFLPWMGRDLFFSNGGLTNKILECSAILYRETSWSCIVLCNSMMCWDMYSPHSCKVPGPWFWWPDPGPGQSSAEDYAGSAEAEMFQGFGPSYMSVAGVARQRMAIAVEESCFLLWEILELHGGL
jgi:hypothetical protein